MVRKVAWILDYPFYLPGWPMMAVLDWFGTAPFMRSGAASAVFSAVSRQLRHRRWVLGGPGEREFFAHEPVPLVLGEVAHEIGPQLFREQVHPSDPEADCPISPA